MDDNLTTIMFLGRSGRRLDFHFILWDFDLQTHLKEDAYRELITLDNGLIPGYDDKEDAEDDVVTPRNSRRSRPRIRRPRAARSSERPQPVDRHNCTK